MVQYPPATRHATRHAASGGDDAGGNERHRV